MKKVCIANDGIEEFLVFGRVYNIEGTSTLDYSVICQDGKIGTFNKNIFVDLDCILCKHNNGGFCGCIDFKEFEFKKPETKETIKTELKEFLGNKTVSKDNTTLKTFTDTQKKIITVCDEIKEMLLEKNRKYGDSALNPVRVFSKASIDEQIKVRLDDKLSRLRSSQGDDTEDVIKDLIGYLVLLKVADLKKHEENCY